MAYRLFEISAIVASDSNQTDASSASAVLSKTVDNETCDVRIRVAPADAEAAITLGTLTTAYGIMVFSDYPILVRPNGASATQFTTTSCNVPATNVGAPLPYSCFFGGTFQCTSLRVAPISGAAQTANVRIIASGDPTSSYV